MKVYRLTKSKYANLLDGKGAAKSTNRWNSKGIEMIYTAESRSLAMAEVLVHLSLANLPSKMSMVEIEIPQTIKFEKVELNQLSSDWNCHPPSIKTQLLGDEFIQSKKALICRVPSAVVKGDFNYLINPNHPEISKVTVVKISDFPFDKRIFEG